MQTLQQYPSALGRLTVSSTTALEALQSVLPLQAAAEEVCQSLTQHPELRQSALLPPTPDSTSAEL